VTGPTCENCGVPRQAHDVFCESCGYDFATGSLPETGDDPDANTGRPPTPSIPVHTKISVDSAFFAASVGEDVDLELPDPVPDQHIVPLNGTRILIGRTSQSRGIFPEIDVQALNADPAVSSRHAMLELDPAGQWTLTDLGSTNGTFLSADAAEPIEAGVALPVAPGTTFFVGAWTRIELAET
jgi:pSer/pThr/pTyr-binding forkhead associated (FHA) protein